MPNRIIKESICTSDDINELSCEEETFFYRLIVNCDDFGRFDAREKILRSRLYPLKLDKVSLDDIGAWLKTVVEKGMVNIYEVDGNPYLQIANWSKHQQIRAKKSKFPAPTTDSISSDSKMQTSASMSNQLIADESVCKQMQSSDINCNQLIYPQDSMRNHLISDDIKCNQTQSSDGICSRESESESEYENPNPNPNPNARDDAYSQIANVYQTEIGVVSDIARQKLFDWLESYSPEWVRAAIEEAVHHNARSPAYVESILKGWAKRGFKVRPEKWDGARPSVQGDSNRLSVIENAKRRFASGGS